MHHLARALAMAAAAAVAAPLVAPTDVALAVVRADGRLQPLAALAGDAWTTLAPTDAAGDWSLWLFDDPAVKTSAFALRTARPVTAAAAVGACLPVPGLDAGAM